MVSFGIQRSRNSQQVICAEQYVTRNLGQSVTLDSVTKIFVITVKGLKPATQPPLVCETVPQYQQDTCRDRIFKLCPIQASVIFRFPEFPEFSESSALFRKNSTVSNLCGYWSTVKTHRFSSTMRCYMAHCRCLQSKIKYLKIFINILQRTMFQRQGGV